MGSPPDSAPPRPRRVKVARVLAWVFAAAAAVLMMGLIDLLTVLGLANPAYVWEVPLEASWGALFTFAIAASFGWIGRFPDRPWPALVLLGVAVGALAVCGLLLGDTPTLRVAGGLAAATIVVHLLLRPARPTPLRRPTRWFRMTVVAAGVVVWVTYAWTSYTDALTSTVVSITNGVDHWPVQVALGLTLAAACVLSAGRSRGPVLWQAAFVLTSAFLSYGSLAYPSRGGASPMWLAVSIAVWGAAVLALWLVERRTT